jgi:hypothetical protein
MIPYKVGLTLGDRLGGVDGDRGRLLGDGCEGRQGKKQGRETEGTHTRRSLSGSGKRLPRERLPMLVERLFVVKLRGRSQ